MNLPFNINNVWELLFVCVAFSAHFTYTWLGNRNSKRSTKTSELALAQATAANKALNDNPIGVPRAYDMLGIIRDEIGSVSDKIDAVDNKLDTHLSWHHQVEQSKPRSAPQSSGRTRKTVAKKAPVKKVASKT